MSIFSVGDIRAARIDVYFIDEYRSEARLFQPKAKAAATRKQIYDAQEVLTQANPPGYHFLATNRASDNSRNQPSKHHISRPISSGLAPTYTDDPPTPPPQRAMNSLIAIPINVGLELPEGRIYVRYPPLLARVTATKAPLHENYQIVFWQSQIWSARQFSNVQAKSRSLPM